MFQVSKVGNGSSNGAGDVRVERNVSHRAKRIFVDKLFSVASHFLFY